ncbi:DUF4253 domain-containing protein [Streptomyces erythrochromogenes]|uniref:DUF4253 domain-containing protein n=1 Tax=Streptomyces erythrochromogenes TaxID=285574 RepID=UPI0036B77AD0
MLSPHAVGTAPSTTTVTRPGSPRSYATGKSASARVPSASAPAPSTSASPHPRNGLEDALPIAAEHFAFCPDNVWQGAHPPLAAYAEHLIDLNCWEFWWD